MEKAFRFQIYKKRLGDKEKWRKRGKEREGEGRRNERQKGRGRCSIRGEPTLTISTIFSLLNQKNDF